MIYTAHAKDIHILLVILIVSKILKSTKKITKTLKSISMKYLLN